MKEFASVHRSLFGQLVGLRQHRLEVVLGHERGIRDTMEIDQHDFRLVPIESVGMERGPVDLPL